MVIPSHPTNGASVNEVKVCSHEKVKSEITALSDANTTRNEKGSAPSISVSQCVLRQGKQEPSQKLEPLLPGPLSRLLLKRVLPGVCLTSQKGMIFILEYGSKQITGSMWE